MSGSFRSVGPLFAVLGLIALSVTGRAGGGAGPVEPEVSINEIMVAAHVRDIDGKGNRSSKRNLDTRVLSGRATEQEKTRLLELYRQLATTIPPKGSPGEWRRRTAALVEATEGVIAGRDGARRRLAEAVDCKTCHEKYRVFGPAFGPGLNSRLTYREHYDKLQRDATNPKDLCLPRRPLVERADRVRAAGGRTTIKFVGGPTDGWNLLVDFTDPCSDESLRPLTSAEQLTELRILKGGVTDTGLGHLRELPGLKTLVVTSEELTDQGMKSIGKLTALTQLDVFRAGLTEKGLGALTGLTDLKELYLSGADVRDGDVEPLKTMRHLEWLSLPPSVSKAKHEELQRALPKTRILRDAAK
jgi:hypothetical protein